MKNISQYILTVLFFFILTSINLHSSTISNFKIDHERKLIVINENIDIVSNAILPSNIISLDADYIFLEPVGNLRIGTAYSLKNLQNEDSYILYFSQLPIIEIKTQSQQPIVSDETYLLANFKIIDDNPANRLTSNIGIKYRGSSSLSFPKKSFRIEFWEGTDKSETKDVSLLGMKRDDDDWILQGLFNEPLRSRSKMNFDLWRELYEPYYRDKEKNAIMGINFRYAELFINNEYRGVYGVGEMVDRKQLKLKKYKDGIKGELYKGVSWGASTYQSLPSFTNGEDLWGGFEYDYPDEIEPYWNNVYDFVSFVINSSDQEFYSQIGNKFDINNAINYYIFLNLLQATDNTGKNIWLAKYDANEPYFNVPWDLDLTFGYVWTGDNIYQAKRESNTIKSNGLYNRLLVDLSPNGFVEKLEQQWSELRSTGIISQQHLMDLFLSNYNYLNENGVYKRELIAWGNYFNTNLEEELAYISGWIEDRLILLDSKYNYNPNSQKEIAVSKITTMEIYPNPASDFVCVNINSSEIYDDYNINIYDSKGSLRKKCVVNSENNKISLSELNNGIYFLHFSGNSLNESGGKKIIIKK